MHRFNRTILQLALSAVLAAGVSAVDPGLSTPAWGQDSSEDILVVARRREENIQKVPVAVTALSGKKIEQLTINNAQDVNKLVAGLQVSGSTNRETFQPSIRGQGTQFSTGQNSVISYFADIANFEVSFYDLDSVQVVKGPQGTLFGETATGGVILFQPRKPSEDFGGYGKVQLGNYAYKQFEGAINVPLVEDKLFVRATGQYRKRNGFTTAIFSYGAPPTDYDNVDTKQWRVSVLWKPTDNIESYTMYAGRRGSVHGLSQPISYGDPKFLNPLFAGCTPSTGTAPAPQFVCLKINTRFPFPGALPAQAVSVASAAELAAAWLNGAGTLPPAGLSFAQMINQALARQAAAGPRVTFANYDRSKDEKFTGVVNQTSWDVLDNLTIKNIFGVFWSSVRGPIIDIDGTDHLFVDTRATWEPGGTNQFNAPYAWTGGTPNRSWREELQLQGNLFDGRLEWQAGGYYRINSSRRFQGGQGVIDLFAFPQGDPASENFCLGRGATWPCSQAGTSRSRSEAGYFQATYAILDNLHFTGGYRRTWDLITSQTGAVATNFITVNGFQFATPIYNRPLIPGSTILNSVNYQGTANTYNVTFDWQVTDSTLLYVAHRQGYKGGGVNANALPGDPNRNFGPETIKDIEVGAKGSWDIGGMRARANVAAFRAWYKDIQRSQIQPGTATTFTTNIADTILQGFEIEAVLTPVPWLELGGNFSLTDNKYTKWPETKACSGDYWRPQCLQPGNVGTQFFIDHAKGIITFADGTVLRFQPDLAADTSKIQWAFQPALLLEEWLGEDISIRANVYHRSRFSPSPTNISVLAGVPRPVFASILGSDADPYIVAASTVADLRFDWRNIMDTNVSLGGSVTNVTNKTYGIEAAGGFTIGGTTPSAIAEPRMWYIELSYAFGPDNG